MSGGGVAFLRLSLARQEYNFRRMRRPARDRDPESCKSSRDSFVVCLDGRLRGQKIRPAVMDDDKDAATTVVVVNVFCPSSNIATDNG